MIRPVEMMQPARRVAAVALVAVALAARSAQAQDAASPPRFRLFPETAAPADPKRPDGAPASKPEKRFWTAAGELLGLEVVSWGFNRYVMDQDYAHISSETVRNNLHAGFAFDNDKFTTNQLGHSIGGSFYFNAPRSNGFTFWESILFTAAGSAIWEIAAESQGPSLNDLVNTTFGGAVSGEACYRLSQMILDDRARGGARVAREALAGLINPAQLVTRLLTGDVRAVRPDRGDYLEPSRFVAQIDAGWRHFISSRRANPDQALFTAAIRYGDPFDRTVSRPFDSFDLGIDVSFPSSGRLTRVEVRGLLGGWDLDPGSTGVRHVVGLFMDFDYTNDDPRVFSSQSFRFGLLSMRPLGKGVELRAEALGVVAPLVALLNDHPDESHGLVGRPYDYGPGAAVFTAVRFRRDELDLVTLTYSVFWTHTSNGIARSSAIQSFRAEGRIPLSRMVALGGSWGWGRRVTSYDDFATVNVAASQGRFFAALTLR
jgi:Domain of unknown function (DUF3943)